MVEGTSDQIAIETLARRLGRDLAAEGVAVVPIGGAQAVARALAQLAGVRVAGLCDAGEQRDFERAFGAGRFFVCDPDLEGELIRALGPERVEAVAEANGDLRAFRTLQKQAAWHGRPRDEQLRRWLGSGGRRKIRYASLLVDALELDEIPRPLAGLLAYLTP
ncbi:MAG TPA: TOPRIM nucleotidyl transferase/hydrolase domain-containing protein [Gaiellaceae bacterium]|nr:TOPRIM nucleotidyl transferase/hydrolase domain-containing protein [Gaiellaceae bacterium]